MDELSVDARVLFEKCDKNVGHVCRTISIQVVLIVKSEGQKGFSEFHVYVCAALLDKYNPQILRMHFQVRTLQPFPMLTCRKL